MNFEVMIRERMCHMMRDLCGCGAENVGTIGPMETLRVEAIPSIQDGHHGSQDVQLLFGLAGGVMYC
jgi:hypothetical protein